MFVFRFTLGSRALWFLCSDLPFLPFFNTQNTICRQQQTKKIEYKMFFFRRYVKKQVSEFECSHKQKCVEQIKKKSQNANDRRPQQQQISKAQKFKKETKFKKIKRMNEEKNGYTTTTHIKRTENVCMCERVYGLYVCRMCVYFACFASSFRLTLSLFVFVFFRDEEVIAFM